MTRPSSLFLPCLALCAVTLCSSAASARDLRISNVQVLPAAECAAPEHAKIARCIQFDIEWHDSWRDQINWDAVWVFVKYRIGDSTAWGHATLSEQVHQAPPGAEILGTRDQKGIFLQRAPGGATAPGGAVTPPDLTKFQAVKVLWMLPVQAAKEHAYLTRKGQWMLPEGKQALENASMEMWVSALEMVHVPEGAFYVGDEGCGPAPGAGAPGCFYDASRPKGPLLITSERALTVGKGGQLGYRSDDGFAGDGAGPIPAKFPKGYHAFYGMKYELTQGQYSDFVNAMEGAHKMNRFPFGGQGAYRFEIYFTAKKERTALRPERAANWLSWEDDAAYLDWAALRPLTELEYEKLARGPLPPVSGELAWGSAEALPANIIVGSESGNIQLNGNVNIDMARQFFRGGDGGQGPLPGHAFEIVPGEETDRLFSPARRLFSWENNQIVMSPARFDRQSRNVAGRAMEGRSYYGAMQLSGNLWELTVSVGNKAGRSFDGAHGDGDVGEHALADVPTWPNRVAEGVSFRGGAWFTDVNRGRVADRFYASYEYASRSHDAGCRGARTAP